jgi:hypothetical protein
MPISMIVTNSQPLDFFSQAGSKGNVALTAVFLEGRFNIAVTNLSQKPLERLTVEWWMSNP